MSDIDFSPLTDDQIVELARQLGAEINRRNPGVADAAKSAIMEEIARSRQNSDAIWTAKKWLSTMVVDQLGERWSLNVWFSRDRAIVRVYLENTTGDYRSDQKWCLHVTGDNDTPPDTLKVGSGSRAEKADPKIVRIIATEALRAFPDGVNIECDTAAKTLYDIPPMPTELTTYVENRRQAKERADVRDAYERQVRSEEFAQRSAAVEQMLEATGKRFEFDLPQDQRDILQRMARDAAAQVNHRMAEYDQRAANV